MIHAPVIPKIERLLNLVSLLLKRQEPVSWERDIKGRVQGYDDQASDGSLWRRFSRDKVELRALGVEIEHVQDGPAGEGYRLDRSRYFLPPVTFTQDEVVLLSLLAGMARDGDAALARPLGDALEKLQYAGPLPAQLVREASERYLFHPLARKTPQLTSNLEGVGQAIWKRRTLSFRYVPAKASPGAPGVRRVDPYGLGYRAGVWYLCGRDHDRDDIRLFRLDRIRGKAGPSGGGFEIPDGFRLSDHFGFQPWEMGRGNAEKAVLKLDPDIAWMAEGARGGRVKALVRDPQALYAFLGRFGPRARLVSPASLRKGYRAWVKRVQGRHR